MKDKIKEIVIKNSNVYIFTNEPDKDILILKEAYEKRDEEKYEFPLGYETPELTEYTFLGNKYPCISLWFDNEDVPEYFLDF